MTKEQVEKDFIKLRKNGDVYIKCGSVHHIREGTRILFRDNYAIYDSRGMSRHMWYSGVTALSNKPMLNYDTTMGVSVGSDPEFFFVDDKGLVVPSNLVIPDGQEGETVIRDGFQGELNPASSYCRQTAGSNIGHALLKAVRYANQAGVKVSLKTGHIISDSVWKSTPMSMRRFGCNPTENVHENTFKRVSGMRERFRAAGGHVHLGLPASARNDLAKIIALMDIYVGNTCVMIDRDPDNARRRKNYGRAGEHRVKTYGVEYRVLSNFWLRSYTMWSMVSVLCRNAVDIHTDGYADELISRFDMKKIRKAINENDFELAKENFEILRTFIKEYNVTGNGLDVSRVDRFYKWATAKRDPLKTWDTLEKTLRSWRGKTYGVGVGFETFINRKK